MDGLCRRMEDTITRIQRPTDKTLARQLLTWGIHVLRSLAAEELADASEPEYGRLLDFMQTTTRLCRHFLAIGRDKIGLVHHTAREYLTTTMTLPFALEATSGTRSPLFLNKILRMIVLPSEGLGAVAKLEFVLITASGEILYPHRRTVVVVQSRIGSIW